MIKCTIKAKKIKKTCIFIAIILAFFLIIRILPPTRAENEISDAVVNPMNGDIAIAYYDTEAGITHLELYNIEGELLFAKILKDTVGIYINIDFDGEKANFYIVRESTCYAFFRNGDETVPSKITEGTPPKWEGWEKDHYNRTYEYENYVYRYEATSYPKNLFKSECSMSVENKNTKEKVTFFSRGEE